MNQHRHKSIRLPGYDYSQDGAYFITICTQNRECILSAITDGAVQLSPLGNLVEAEWRRTADLRPNVALDEFVIMPNHLHAIVFIVRATSRSPLRDDPTPPSKPPGPAPRSLSAIVAGFKSAVTSRVNQARDTPGAPLWQDGYYEHVIRDERDLYQARLYTVGNPSRWELDDENPARHAPSAAESQPRGRSGDLRSPTPDNRTSHSTDTTAPDRSNCLACQ